MSTEYNILFIKEHNGVNGKIDQQIIILSDEDGYFLYGSRDPRQSEEIKFDNYSFHYPKERVNTLTYLLEFVLDHYQCKFTLEIHNIFIDEDDMDDVDFDYLFCQINKYNEIVAYDETRLSLSKLKSILDCLH